MKKSKKGFEQNIVFIIKGNHTLNTIKNNAVARKIIFTYDLNEEKGKQE